MVEDQAAYVRKIVRAKIAAFKGCPNEDKAFLAIFSELMSTQVSTSAGERFLQILQEEISADPGPSVDRICS